MTFRNRVNTIAEQLPGAVLGHPHDSEHDAWKVGSKMFTCIGAVNPGVSVKTPDTETAQMLIEAGVAHKAAYFHRSWVTMPEHAEEGELRHRIVTSYDIVRSGLTKKAQAALPQREDV